MHLLSLLALLLSLLYVIPACAPNGGIVPTPSPGDGTDPATAPPDEAAPEEERRRRRSNAMRSSVEKIDLPLPDIHNLYKFNGRNDSVRVIVHKRRERRR